MGRRRGQRRGRRPPGTFRRRGGRFSVSWIEEDNYFIPQEQPPLQYGLQIYLFPLYLHEGRFKSFQNQLPCYGYFKEIICSGNEEQQVVRDMLQGPLRLHGHVAPYGGEL